jgi:hypothetical protein
VDKTTAQQPKVQQLESTGFQAAATAETSGIQHDSVGGEVRRKESGVRYIFPPKTYIYIYKCFLAGKNIYTFFGGKI